jgi:hypothetical protein
LFLRLLSFSAGRVILPSTLPVLLGPAGEQSCKSRRASHPHSASLDTWTACAWKRRLATASLASRLLASSLTLQCITCITCKSTPVNACTPQYSVDSVRSTEDKTRQDPEREQKPERLARTQFDFYIHRSTQWRPRSDVVEVKTTSRLSIQHFNLHVGQMNTCSLEANDTAPFFVGASTRLNDRRASAQIGGRSNQTRR